MNNIVFENFRLKQLDVEIMKKLHDRVNVIPVIAKADTLTVSELSHFKSQVIFWKSFELLCSFY